MDMAKTFGSPRSLYTIGNISYPHWLKYATLGGYDAKISSAFTSTKNLVIFRQSPVMQNP